MNPKRIALLGLVAGLFAACTVQPATVAAETPALLKVSPPVDSAFVPSAVPTSIQMYAFKTCATLPAVSVVKASHASMASLAPPVDSSQPSHSGILPLGLIGILLAGTLTSVSGDKDTYPPSDTVRKQLNLLMQLVRYFQLNGVASTTIATQPGCAIATVTSKVKTVAGTVLWCNGVAVALGASDNYWILAPVGHLATGFSRKYLLCSNAAGVASVIASSDAATAGAAAGCLFTNLPADGVAIVGQLQVDNASGADFIPATTLLGAAGITTTFIDNHDDTLIKSIINTVTP